MGFTEVTLWNFTDDPEYPIPGRIGVQPPHDNNKSFWKKTEEDCLFCDLKLGRLALPLGYRALRIGYVTKPGREPVTMATAIPDSHEVLGCKNRHSFVRPKAGVPDDGS